MKQLKEEFAFQYNKTSVQVKKLGEVWCAVAGKSAKSLKIEFCEGIHVGKISNQEGKFLAWLPKAALKETTQEDILKELKLCKTFGEFLIFVRDCENLQLTTDGNWSWLEYNGKEIEGTGKERFTSSSEIDSLLKLAGL